MPLVFLALVVFLLAVPASAQPGASSSGRGDKSAVEDTSAPDSPTSLARIREQLERVPARSIFEHLDRKPDFRSEVQVQQRIDELLSKLDLKSGPRVPGGVYAYEQQQRLFNPTNRPLMQPYAAYSGGELITLAIEGLVQKYLAGRAVEAITSWDRARAEAQARAEVAHAVGEYCSAQPAAGATIDICEKPLSAR